MAKKEDILKLNKLNVEFPIFGGVFQREIDCVHAVKDVSFNIKEGETIGIVGESGSGKSTLGKAILNVLQLTAPDVRVSGEILLNHTHKKYHHLKHHIRHPNHNDYIDLMKLPKKEFLHYRPEIQMIFQDPYSSLNPRMIVKDIIQEPLNIHTDLSKNEKEEKVFWLLEKVGLSKDQALRYPHEFSGGQRQRIGIARSLATEPRIIIADEPVSALDVSIQAQVINLMMDLQDEFNLTILFIAHDLSVVKHISTEVAVMYLGELVEYNTTKNIFNSPQHDYTKTLLKAIPHPDPHDRDKRKQERLNS